MLVRALPEARVLDSNRSVVFRRQGIECVARERLRGPACEGREKYFLHEVPIELHPLDGR